ncbi:MAG TPA: hypothetical protein VGH27_07255 [Streptosporangiaceae bacterium]
MTDGSVERAGLAGQSSRYGERTGLASETDRSGEEAGQPGGPD